MQRAFKIKAKGREWKKQLSPRILGLRERYFLGTSMVFLFFLSWSGFLSFLEIPLTFQNLIYLHGFIAVWIVNGLIIAYPVTLIYGLHLLKQKSLNLKSQVKVLEERLTNNYELAKALETNTWESLAPMENDSLASTLVNIGVNFRSSKKKETEHNWIAQGKEHVSDILRNAHNLEELSVTTLKSIINYCGAIQGAIYILEENILERRAMHAYGRRRFEYNEVKIGHGLIGAAAYEKAIIYRTEIPDDYFSITSGLLGEQKPKCLVIVPLLQEESLQGVMEIAFIEDSLPGFKLQFISEIGSTIGQTIYNLKITTRTEQLLKESRQLTATLRENEEQLRENASEMIIAKENLERSNMLLEAQMQEVANARKRLEELLSNASEFISIYDENQQLVFESPSVKRILGYSDADKITGMDPEILTPRGFKTINNLFQYLLDTPGGEQTAQYTYLRKNGEKLFLETKGKNLLHDPAIRGIVFNTQDITERKRAEKEERMKSRMQSLSENSPDMIIRVNLMGKLVYVNPAVSRFIHLPAHELIKKRVNELDIDNRFTTFVQESLATIRETLAQTISEVSIESSSGERIMEIKAIPELGEEGELETVLFVAHDLTELKKIEADIKEKNKKISDSINYAQNIQTSILPDNRVIQKYFPRSFIFYRPKDVVSGDFPWFFQKNNVSYVAAIDCTGHGVPGALISFIGYFLLNNIVSAKDTTNAAEILDELHLQVRGTLKQDQEGALGRDGMDLALCIIDRDNQTLNFSGAHRPLYLLRDGQLNEYLGSRKSIGGIPLSKKIEKPFENHVINYHAGDQIFFFSDGLPDQIGGSERKKYQSRRIRETLTSNPGASMAHFARYFPKDFHDWMGTEKQVDDVLLIGIEL